MNYIGIDLGGTNIKGALVSAGGEILKEHSVETRVDLGPEAVAARIGAVIAHLFKELCRGVYLAHGRGRKLHLIGAVIA